jgi:hypothetical protein
METGMLITVYLTSALVAGLLAGIIAPAKRRHGGYWVLFSFLFPPSVLLLLILPRGRFHHNPRRDPFQDSDDHDDLFGRRD